MTGILKPLLRHQVSDFLCEYKDGLLRIRTIEKQASSGSRSADTHEATLTIQSLRQV